MIKHNTLSDKCSIERAEHPTLSTEFCSAKSELVHVTCLQHAATLPERTSYYLSTPPSMHTKAKLTLQILNGHHSHGHTKGMRRVLLKFSSKACHGLCARAPHLNLSCTNKI